MASCSSDEKCMLSERFEQRAVIKSCAKRINGCLSVCLSVCLSYSGMTPTETWKFFSSIADGAKSVQDAISEDKPI